MKPKPLKGKIRSIILSRGEVEKIEVCQSFCYISDIRSAVEWLLSEIDKEIEKIETNEEYARKESYRLFKKMGEDIGYDEALALLKSIILKESKQKIKTAFEDVMEGGNEHE